MTRTITNCALVLAASLLINMRHASGQEAINDPASATNLYLMRNLEHVYSTWKSPATDPAELGEWIATTRDRLNAFKTAAEAYKRDEDVIRAYGDTLALLEKYEEFLKDVVYFDLITDLAQPERAEFLTQVSRGAAEGSLTGLGTGTIVFPVVGSVCGAKAGAAIGGVGAAFNWLFSYRESINSNRRIDELRKRAKLQLTDALDRQFKSTVTNTTNLANILGGEKKYGWGQQVGFEPFQDVSLVQQLSRRPNDSFLHVNVAIGEARDKPRQAAMRLARAAELVPSDVDANVDIFDRDRAEFLLTATRIAERGSQLTNDAGLAALAVQYYQAACKSLARGDAGIPTEMKLVYARACARTGNRVEADTIVTTLRSRDPQNPWMQVEEAGVKATAGDIDAALDSLRQSFRVLPRWQPYALSDPRLAALNMRKKEAVERICAHPLVGQWTGIEDLTLEFYPDGFMRQKSRGVVKSGSFEESGQQKIVFRTSEKARTYTYDVSKSALRLQGEGQNYELHRVKPELMGTWQYGDGTFEFREDGTWKKVGGSVITFGTYAIISPRTDDSLPEILYSRDDVAIATISKQVAYRVRGDSLDILVPNVEKPYRYSRVR